MSSFLAIGDLRVSLGGVEIVRNVSTAVEAGSWVTMIGPNGAGKTTILRALAGHVSFSGSISLGGDDLASCSSREIARRIALVPQHPSTPAELTVSEYVLLGRTPHISYLSTEKRSDRRAAERAITRLSLRSFAERPLGTLSGGELQRAVLARALAQEARILLLDEPTSALDLGHQQEALDILDSLRREEGLTVISAMHDLSLAGQYADRLLLIDRGRLVADGDATSVLSEANIAGYYRARVRIIHDQGHVFVLPEREVSR